MEEVIDCKYGTNNSERYSGEVTVGLWKHIRLGRTTLHDCIFHSVWGRMWFSNSVLETILGWKWNFSRPLSGIIQFVRDQDGQLSDYMEWVNGRLHWKPVFIREAQDWELESMAHPKKDLHLGATIGCCKQALRLLPCFLGSVYEILFPLLEFLFMFGRSP